MPLVGKSNNVVERPVALMCLNWVPVRHIPTMPVMPAGLLQERSAVVIFREPLQKRPTIVWPVMFTRVMICSIEPVKDGNLTFSDL